jgi:predicted Rdx family selenoprotein
MYIIKNLQFYFVVRGFVTYMFWSSEFLNSPCTTLPKITRDIRQYPVLFVQSRCLFYCFKLHSVIQNTNYTVSTGDVIYLQVRWEDNNLLWNWMHRAAAHCDILFRTEELYEELQRVDLHPALHPTFELGVTGIETQYRYSRNKSFGFPACGTNIHIYTI